MNDQNVISVRDIQKSFGTNHVLKGVDLEVAAGEVVVVLGSSGSGKSTLLRCLNQLEIIDDGWIEIDGDPVGHEITNGRVRKLSSRRVAEQRSRIGMVFQQFNLFPHKTVLENIIEAPIHVKKQARDAAVANALVLLEKVGLEEKRDAYPAHLSGGQRQRVAIARALAMEPKVLLFDEPTSALDPELIGEVLQVMIDLARGGMTMVVVTHEIAFAQSVADRVVFMDGGRIIQVGTVNELMTAPKTPRVATFMAQLTA